MGYYKKHSEFCSRIINGFDECNGKFVGYAVFDSVDDRDECLADYAEFQRKYEEELKWHNDHDEDWLEWFEDNQYGAEVLEDFAQKHNGIFIWLDWDGESVLV